MKSLKQVHVCVLFIKNPSYLCNFCRFLTNQIPSCLYMQLGPANETSGKLKQTEGGQSIIHTFVVFLHLTTLHFWTLHSRMPRDIAALIQLLLNKQQRKCSNKTKSKKTVHFHLTSTVFTSMQIAMWKHRTNSCLANLS